MAGFHITTLYGAQSQAPLVQIHVEGTPEHPNTLQVDITTARQLALNLLQATEAAIQDAFIIEFFEELGMEADARQALLHAFRLRRHDRQTDATP